MVASRVRARVIVRNANLGITEKSDRDALKVDSAEATMSHQCRLPDAGGYGVSGFLANVHFFTFPLAEHISHTDDANRRGGYA